MGVVSADGSGTREVARIPGGMRAPRWSPDGRTLAMVFGSGLLLAGSQQSVVLVDAGLGPWHQLMMRLVDEVLNR